MGKCKGIFRAAEGVPMVKTKVPVSAPTLVAKSSSE
jgi:hypothetical protein